MAKRLRSGFTTGACAAAAAKAAATLLLGTGDGKEVEIPFPDGSRKSFTVFNSGAGEGSATASIIKDAGDDPDVTNGAEIVATVQMGITREAGPDCVEVESIMICGGEGVGTVTKPGLSIKPGEPAINPVPRKMILQAVREVVGDQEATITISVPAGRLLAEKTLNHRLGILGGLSILGTTGIVRPVSADAWTATINASLDVAKQAGLKEVVLSTGRSSERGAQNHLHLPDEAYAMMGDYLEFSLKAVKEHNFSTLHYAGMWAKIVKAALRIPQTHVRNGPLEIHQAAGLLRELGAEETLVQKAERANTAREILTILDDTDRQDLIRSVCQRAKSYCEDMAGCTVHLYLIDHKSRIIEHV